MWTSITITVSNHSNWAHYIREEVSILFEQNLLNCKSMPLVIEELVNDDNSNSEDKKTDPAMGFFENFAFFNALFLTMENQGYSSSDLGDKNILIIHHGRNCCYWPGNAKILCPTNEPRNDGSGLKSYLEYIIALCSQLKKGCKSGGVWFAGTESLINGRLENFNYDWEHHAPDVLCVTFNSRDFSKYCGYVEHDPDGVVTRIVGDRTSEENLLEALSGIVFFKATVVKTISQLISKAPLDRTTYIGQDNGESPLQLSLYFDILGPLYAIGKDYYLSGLYSIFPLMEDTIEKRDLRELLWQYLSNYKLKVLSVVGLRHCFITDQLPLEHILACNSLAITYGKSAKVLHSYVSKEPKEPLKCANSVIEAELELSNNKELVVVSSTIQGSKTLKLAGAACLITTSLPIDMVPGFRLINNFCMIGISIRVNNELKKGRFVCSIADIPSESNHSCATYFGLPWSKYLNLKGIQEEDIWSTGTCKTLLSARLFPLAENITGWRNLLWLQTDVTDKIICPSRLESWRSSKRYSINEFFQMCDPADSLQHLRSTAGIGISKSIFNQPLSLAPFFQRACAEKWTETLIRVCDEKAATGDNNRDISRALAAIADLLAFKAGLKGARSGPGCNKEWAVALHLFEHVSLEEGVMAMANTRSKWMDTPERLIRASRHYEKAIQILISSTVNTVQNYMVNHELFFQSSRPEIGTWVEVECPARIDLAGGWSDTPPICWEIESGGAVVNLAILVNGKRPIGAKGRRLDDLKLVLVSEGSSPVTISSLDDALNYNNPTAFGSLLKAVLVCAGVVQHDKSLNLSQQLQKSLGSGLELHSWSLLPSGSGLGTSSILASALLAVAYTLMHGVCFNRSHLIHAVLRVESLLTTGGGWQDQVGGIMGGCNLGYSPCDSKLRVKVNNLALSEKIVNSINQRLILIHTGQVRLARNLLQSVIRNWYGCDESITHHFHYLVDNAKKCAADIVSGNLEELGRHINVYWKQKKAIAPGCEPKVVSELMETMSSLVYGQSLAGAGGGGFYYALLNDAGSSCPQLNHILSTFNKEKMVVYSATVDQNGIRVVVFSPYVIDNCVIAGMSSLIIGPLSSHKWKGMQYSVIFISIVFFVCLEFPKWLLNTVMGLGHTFLCYISKQLT